MVSNGSKTYTVDFKKHKLLSEMDFADGENLLEANAQQNAFAYLKGSNLYVRTFDVTSNALTKEKKSHDFQLSKDGSREIVYGQSVHRDEFGISKGTFWSPNGELLAFYRMDQSMVTDYPQVDIPEIGFNHPETQSCIATPAPDKYPMTGETSHKVTVGVFDCMTGKTIYLKAGDPTDRYFTNIAWSPDSKTIYMFELNRDQNDCRLTATMQKPARRQANSIARPMRNTWSLATLSSSCLGTATALSCRAARMATTTSISAPWASTEAAWPATQNHSKSSS